jgi:hypothetical protein
MGTIKGIKMVRRTMIAPKLKRQLLLSRLRNLTGHTKAAVLRGKTIAENASSKFKGKQKLELVSVDFVENAYIK